MPISKPQLVVLGGYSSLLDDTKISQVFYAFSLKIHQDFGRNERTLARRYVMKDLRYNSDF